MRIFRQKKSRLPSSQASKQASKQAGKQASKQSLFLPFVLLLLLRLTD
jgi:hypothetical protein